MNAAAAHKEHQDRMLTCLSTLSLFSKAKPDLMVKHAETLQPYLSMNMNGPAEQQVMNQVLLIFSNFRVFEAVWRVDLSLSLKFLQSPPELQTIFNQIRIFSQVYS